MATDGVKIVDGDFAHDLYSEFMELYDAGKPIDEIKAAIETQRDPDDGFEQEIFITVYALALWQVGELTPEILQEVKQAIERGAGAEVWAEEIDEKEANKRRRELEKFWLKINQPNPKPRKRKFYKVITNFVFDENEVLVFQIPDGNYCATILVEIFQHQGRCHYYFVASTYKSRTKPTLDDIKSSEIIGRKKPLGFGNYGVWLDTISVGPKLLRSFKDNFEQIGKLKILEVHKEIGSSGGAQDFASFCWKWENTELLIKNLERVKFPLQELLEN